MGFQIAYTKLLELRCWHPDFLGSVASMVPIAPADALTVNERKDYLRYDLREHLEIIPTEGGKELLKRLGLIWTRSTFGGWLLAKEAYVETDPTIRLQLGVYLRNPAFAAATDFDLTDQQGRLFHLSNANEAVATELDLTGGDLRAIHFVDSQGFQVRLPQLVNGTDSEISLRDPLLSGNPVIRTYQATGGESTTDHYLLELHDLPAGLYRFTGSNITATNLLVGFARRPALLGVIDLRLADWAGSAFDLHFQSSNP